MHVGCMQSFVASFDLEFDFLTFSKSLEAIHRDRREVDEYVFTAILLDEAVTLRVIEPLHFSSGHGTASGHLDSSARLYRISPDFCQAVWERVETAALSGLKYVRLPPGIRPRLPVLGAIALYQFRRRTGIALGTEHTPSTVP